MALRIACQMDHPSRLNLPGDTTIMLLEEAQKRGHQLTFYEATQLTWREGELRAPLTPIAIDMAADQVFTLGDPAAHALEICDVILMRQDPPFDMSYITATHLLEQLKNVAIWNNPASVRNAPEKLSVLPLARFMPATLVSRDPTEIHAFASAHGTIVAKPLYGFGGRSVFKLSAGDSNIDTLIEHWSEQSREPLMWQQFRPEVTTSDKRVIFIDGKVASVFARIPQGDSIRANMRVGGIATASELTPIQQTICETLAPILKKTGIMLAGIDLIGDYLTEINVTSPTGLRAAQRLYNVNLAATFWDAVEAHAKR